jgi:hypothetical protein
MNVNQILAFGLLALAQSGSAQFGPGTVLFPTDAESPLQPIDVDHDGDLDLARLLDGSGLVWYANNGAAGFDAPSVIVEAERPIAVMAFGDLDVDGDPDLLYVEGNDNTLYVRWNNGGDFSLEQLIIPNIGAVGAIALGDLSGDGVPDVAYTADDNGAGARLWWAAFDGAAFATETMLPFLIDGAAPAFMRTADVDLAGGIDIVLATATGRIILLRNTDGDGSAWLSDTVHESPVAFTAPQWVDADGDGDLDLAEAAFPEVRWVENTLGEGGNVSAWIPHQLEPWTSAGPGSFGHLGCDSGAGLVVFPYNPGEAPRYAHWVGQAQLIAWGNPLAGIPSGTQPLLADLDGDGRDDLLLLSGGDRLLFLNELEPSAASVDLPPLPALCRFGAPYDLPEPSPGGGRWTGQIVFNGQLLRSEANGSGEVPLTYVRYADSGCASGAAAQILVVEEPAVSPYLSGIICSGTGPVQLQSIPAATQWIGVSSNGVFNPATYAGGPIISVFEDTTGEVCAAEIPPVVVWTSLAVHINQAGPFCINSGPQLITAALAPPFGISWSGSVTSWNSAGATFTPSAAGSFDVILTAEPTGPGQCAGRDTLRIVVSDSVPELAIGTLPPQCAQGDLIDLAELALPAGGIWSGPGVVGTQFDPNSLSAGDHVVTYTYFQDGCGASEALLVNLVDAPAILEPAEGWSFCSSQQAVVLQASPHGGQWNAPIDEGGSFDPSSLEPGVYPITYSWTGPNGCALMSPEQFITIRATSTPAIAEVGVVCINGEPEILQGNLAGTWSGAVNGTGSSIVLDPVLLGLGNWEVILTGAFDGECPGTTSLWVSVEVCAGVTDQGTAGIRAWPNPFVSHLYVQACNQPIALVELADALGRTVEQRGPQAKDKLLAFNLEGNPSGVYFLRIERPDGSAEVLRLVKE